MWEVKTGTTAVVIGAGPAGLLAARNGDALIIEARRRIGRPPHCTGLVSIDTARRLPREAWSQVYDNMRVCVSLTGPCLDLRVRLVRVHRPLLEDILAAEAEANGAEILRGVHARIEGSTLYACMKGECRRLDAETVIVAEGAAWSLASRLGLAPRGKRLYAYQVRVKLYAGMEGIRSYILGRVVKYAWMVPLDNREALIGAAGLNVSAVHALVSRLVKNVAASRVEVRAGLIPYTPPSRRPCRLIGGRLFCVAGDAAGLTKATSGGGLYAIAALSSLYAEVLKRGVDALPLLEREYRVVRSRLLRHYVLAKLYYDYRLLRPLVSLATRLLDYAVIMEYDGLRVEPIWRVSPFSAR